MSDSAVEIFNYSKKSLFVKLLDHEYKSSWAKKLAPFHPEWINSEKEKGWMVSKKYEDELLEVINYKQVRRPSRKPKHQEQKYSRVKKHSREEENKNHKHKEESNYSDEEEQHNSRQHESRNNSKHDHSDRSRSDSSSENEQHSEDESSEDELIQLTLGRKLKYESSQKYIEEDNIENSDLEDVISMCRRIRYLLNANKQLSERIRDLEKQLKKD